MSSVLLVSSSSLFSSLVLVVHMKKMAMTYADDRKTDGGRKSGVFLNPCRESRDDIRSSVLGLQKEES